MHEEHFKTVCRSVMPDIEFDVNGTAIVAVPVGGDYLSDGICFNTSDGSFVANGFVYYDEEPMKVGYGSTKTEWPGLSIEQMLVSTLQMKKSHVEYVKSLCEEHDRWLDAQSKGDNHG